MEGFSPPGVRTASFFLAIFFCVGHDGLRKRWTTRSLGQVNVMSTSDFIGPLIDYGPLNWPISGEENHR